MTENKTMEEYFTRIRLDWNPNFRDPSGDFSQASQKKQEAINDLEKRFTHDLNGISRMSEGSAFKQDFYRDRRYYMLPVILRSEHLNYALENKKAFIKWFLTKYPQYNISYDPKKRDIHTSIKYGREQDAKFFKMNPYYAARQRDLLFGTNGVEAITAENWWQKIRDAQDEQEIEDIKLLLDSKWEIDNFINTVEKLIYVINDELWYLNYETAIGVKKRPKNYDPFDRINRETSTGEKYFSFNSFGDALIAILRHSYDQDFKERFARGGSKNAWGSAPTGSVNALIQLQQEAGMDFCHFVAYDLMHEELNRVRNQALATAQNCEAAEPFMKVFNAKPCRWRGGKDWITPDLVSWSPASSEQTPDKPSSVNPELGQEKELPDKPEVPKQDQEKQIKDKLAEVKDKLKDPKKSQALNKKEIRNELADLGIELINLEKNSDGSDDSKQEIGNLTKQIEELKEQIREIKQSLKSILEGAKDYALKLFNYFKKENVKQITFEANGSAKVEYENNKDSKTFSAQEIDNTEELAVLKEQVQQSEQKTLSRQELSQIVGSTSSPTSTEKSHWENYKYYYFVGIGIGLLVIGGLTVYWLMKKEKKEVE